MLWNVGTSSVFFSEDTPYVLRPTGRRLLTEHSSQTPFRRLVDDVKYSFIGECYVEDAMHGEP
jgi:hypothetical protein